MSRTFPIAAVLVALVAFGRAVPDAVGQDNERQKLAQTGMKFLTLTTDPRAAALGDAMTAVEGGATSLFHNPAAMAGLDGFANLSLGQLAWIADIDYNRVSLALRPGSGRWGVVGASFVSVDYGDLVPTIRVDTDEGFERLAYDLAPTAYSAGVGYARSLSDRFAFGLHVKYARQDLGESVLSAEGGELEMAKHELGTFAYDFGMLYRTGFRSLRFAVAARNFAREVVFEEESFQLPLTVKIGLAMDVLDLVGEGFTSHELLVAVDAEHPRDFSEQIRVGGEYTFLDTFSLRAGYVYPSDTGDLNLGVGIRQSIAGLRFGADYAYTDAGVFNQFSRVQRLALHFTF